MPLSQQDLDNVGNRIWQAQLMPDGTITARTLLEMIPALAGQVAALAETVRQLRIGEDLDLAAVTDAARTGTIAALAEGTVTVDVSVSGAPNPNSAG